MNKIGIALRGMAMGIAEVIPGVSGGTIALITGIYEKLILTIKRVEPELIKRWKANGLTGVNEYLDISFIFALITGMALGILVGVFAISYLFENYPEPLWGFFFGLIIASSIYIGKQIKKWEFQHVIALILGIVVAYGITLISPASGSESYLYVFISGVVAISALILPGISGSFILLLLGMYTVIIPALKNLISTQDLSDLLMLIVFGLGCLTGLVTFSRVMNYLFQRYKLITLAVLSGFMLGSLNKIWPWKNITQMVNKNDYSISTISGLNDLSGLEKESFKILSDVNVLPSEYWMSTPKVFATIISFVIGFIIVFILEKVTSR